MHSTLVIVALSLAPGAFHLKLNRNSSKTLTPIHLIVHLPDLQKGLGVVVGLTLPMARADRGSRPVYYLPCSDHGQVINLSLSVA